MIDDVTLDQCLYLGTLIDSKRSTPYVVCASRVDDQTRVHVIEPAFGGLLVGLELARGSYGDLVQTEDGRYPTLEEEEIDAWDEGQNMLVVAMVLATCCDFETAARWGLPTSRGVASLDPEGSLLAAWQEQVREQNANRGHGGLDGEEVETEEEEDDVTLRRSRLGTTTWLNLASTIEEHVKGLRDDEVEVSVDDVEGNVTWTRAVLFDVYWATPELLDDVRIVHLPPWIKCSYALMRGDIFQYEPRLEATQANRRNVPAHEYYDERTIRGFVEFTRWYADEAASRSDSVPASYARSVLQASNVDSDLLDDVPEQQPVFRANRRRGHR